MSPPDNSQDAAMSDAPTSQMRAHPMLTVDVGGQTDKGRVRPGNEDAFYVEDPGSAQARAQGTLLVVADGMGGHAAGEVASEIAVRTVRDTFYQARGVPTADAIRNAISTANSAIYQSAEHNPNHAGMGCTIVALVVNGSDLTIGHVGDSRAYLIRAGRTHQITADHSWVAMQVAEGILTPEQAAHHPNRSLLLRALGRQPSVEIDVGAGKLQPGDVLLVCSDGLTGVVKDEEIGEYASRNAPKSAADQLIRLANQRGAPDNVTVVTAAIRGSGGALGDASSAATVIVPAVDVPTPRHNKVVLDAPTLRGAEVSPPDGPPLTTPHTAAQPAGPLPAPTLPHGAPPPMPPHGVSLSDATAPMQVVKPTPQPASGAKPKQAPLAPLSGAPAGGRGYGQGAGAARRGWMQPLLTTMFGCLLVGALAFFVAQRAGLLDSTSTRNGDATAAPSTATVAPAYAAPTQTPAPAATPTSEPVPTVRPTVTPAFTPASPAAFATVAPTSAPTSVAPSLGTGGLPNVPGVSGAADAVATRVGGGAITSFLTPGPAASSTPTPAPTSTPGSTGSTQPGPAESATPASSAISSEPAPSAAPSEEPAPTEEQVPEPTPTQRVIRGIPVPAGIPVPPPQQKPQQPQQPPRGR